MYENKQLPTFCMSKNVGAVTHEHVKKWQERISIVVRVLKQVEDRPTTHVQGLTLERMSSSKVVLAVESEFVYKQDQIIQSKHDLTLTEYFTILAPPQQLSYRENFV